MSVNPEGWVSGVQDFKVQIIRTQTQILSLQGVTGPIPNIFTLQKNTEILKMMKNKVFFEIAFLLYSSFLIAQINVKCDACVFLDPDFKGQKALYDKPDGKVVKKLKHDFIEEDYIGFNIIDKNDSMFYVSALYAIKGFISKGWIKKDVRIGIYSNIYKKKTVFLYSKPNQISDTICSIRIDSPPMFNVIDCIGKWLKVKIILKGKKYVGWMSPEMQCCDIYNICG